MTEQETVRYEPRKTVFMYARLAICLPLLYFALAVKIKATQSPADAFSYYSTFVVLSAVYLAIFNVGISLVSRKSWIELSPNAVTLPKLLTSEPKQIRWEDILRISTTINFGYLIVTEDGEDKVNASVLHNVDEFESTLKKFVLPHTELPDNLAS